MHGLKRILLCQKRQLDGNMCVCVKRNIGHSSACYTQILYRVSLKCLLKV